MIEQLFKNQVQHRMVLLSQGEKYFLSVLRSSKINKEYLTVLKNTIH